MSSWALKALSTTAMIAGSTSPFPIVKDGDKGLANFLSKALFFGVNIYFTLALEP